MSYDIYVGGESWNYTSNLSGFLHHYLRTEGYVNGVDSVVTGLMALNNERAWVAVNILDRALHEVEEDISHKGVRWMDGEWNPPNGWGNWKDLRQILRDIRRVCLENPGDTVEIFS